MITVRTAEDFQELKPLVAIEESILKKEKVEDDLYEKFFYFKCLMEKKPFLEKFEFKIFLFEEGGELCGYAICHLTKSKLKRFNEIYVYRVWHNHKHEGLDKLFFKQLNDWAKENGMKKITIRSDSESRVRAFSRKYGMTPISTNLELIKEVI